MPELLREASRNALESSKVRVGRVAGRQEGRITRAQLCALCVPDSTVTRWIATGYLCPQLPGVFGVGHPGSGEEADLFAAVLYAGPGAGLSGMTAGLWRGLVKWRTAEAIEVCTPRHCQSLAADHPRNRIGRPIAVRRGREFRRAFWKGIPTVPVEHIVLDIARGGDVELVRFVLAQMDYLRMFNERRLRVMCGRGVPGSGVLRTALGRPQPLFARARSWFEVRLVVACELTGMRLPDAMNHEIAGHPVDAVWWDEKVVVECDGEGNHGTWHQRRRDVGQEMALRGLRFLPIRYTIDKLDDPWAVYADLGMQLQQRRGLGGLPLLAS